MKTLSYKNAVAGLFIILFAFVLSFTFADDNRAEAASRVVYPISGFIINPAPPIVRGSNTNPLIDNGISNTNPLIDNGISNTLPILKNNFPELGVLYPNKNFDSDVVKLQDFLKINGYMEDVRGYYGSITTEAVKNL